MFAVNNHAVNTAIGGWQVSMINTMRSGQAFTPTYTPGTADTVSGITSSNNGANNYRPNRAPGIPLIAKGDSGGFPTRITAGVFSTPTAGGASPFGNTSRNLRHHRSCISHQRLRYLPRPPYAILHWLTQNEPARIDKARWSLTCNGWLFSKLTGLFLADLSDGSNPFSDVNTAAYSPGLLRLYGLEDRAHLLPPIRIGTDLVASLTACAAEQLGLPIGTPVVMAPYDIVATAYGCDSVSPGQACIILGTTICAEVITSSLDLDVTPTGTTIALGNGSYLRAMPTLTGCEALTWATKALSCESIPELDCLAAASVAGANGLLFLPYLSLAGERSPFLEPNARGSFIGLSLAHTRADMARSIYEALAFVIRDCVKAAAGTLPSELRVCGGGARSDFWCQIIADVIGVPIVRTDDSEVGARGAFLFALAVTGTTSSVYDAVRQHVTAAKTFLPSYRSSPLSPSRLPVSATAHSISSNPKPGGAPPPPAAAA